MLARLLYSLVIGLVVAVPRRYPTPDYTPLPEGAEAPPTPGYLPDGDAPGGPIVGVPYHPEPAVPPTPPPGYEGAWPPGSEDDRGIPPTPPPGYEGDWPGTTGVAVGPFREQLRDLLGQIRALLGSDSPVTQQSDAVDKVRDGAVRLYREVDASEGRSDMA